MGKKSGKLRVTKIIFIPKVFSVSQRAAWDRMWDMLLTKAPEQLREDAHQSQKRGISKMDTE